jgi:ribosomal protein S18 acetylase RimI-like enzyme
MQYTLERATESDLYICDRIHTENMKEYVESVYPRNPSLFRDNFVAKDYRVIKHQNQIIGFIKVVVSPTDIYLGEIQITCSYQDRGIGTNIIENIIATKLNNQRLWLRVIKGNPAEKLYIRLGFTVFEESLTHKKLEIQ